MSTELLIKDFAKRERCTASAVRALLGRGRLRGRKLGRDWLVESDQKMPGKGRPKRAVTR